MCGEPIWVNLSKKKKKRNSFIAHWSADRLDEKVKVPSLKNGSEPKKTMKGGSLPSLPRDSLVPCPLPSKGALDSSLCLYKVQCEFTQTPAQQSLGFRDSKCLASLLVRSDILRLHTVMEFPSREIQFSCSIQTLSLRVSAINNYKTETNKRYKYWKGYILIFAISMSVDLGNPKLTAKLLEAI